MTQSPLLNGQEQELGARTLAAVILSRSKWTCVFEAEQLLIPDEYPFADSDLKSANRHRPALFGARTRLEPEGSRLDCTGVTASF